MLINLPKKITCPMIGRELMKYFIHKKPTDSDPKDPIVLSYMGDMNLKTTQVEMRYYTFVPTESFVAYFKPHPDAPPGVYCIPRDIIEMFYNVDDKLDNGTIIEYAKLVSQLSDFVDSQPYQTSMYHPPIQVIDETKADENEAES